MLVITDPKACLNVVELTTFAERRLRDQGLDEDLGDDWVRVQSVAPALEASIHSNRAAGPGSSPTPPWHAEQIHTGLFQSREAAYLLTTPAPADRIFAYKFFRGHQLFERGIRTTRQPDVGGLRDHGAGLGVVLQAALALPRLLRPNPGGPGCGRGDFRGQLLPEVAEAGARSRIAAFLAVALPLVVQVAQTPGDALSRDWLGGLLAQLAFSPHPLWPSRWMSAGLLSAARGEWSNGLFYLTVLTGHAALSYLLAVVVARDLYRQKYSRVQGGRSSRRRIGWYEFDASFHRIFFFPPGRSAS